jgi:hypothetical protein
MKVDSFMNFVYFTVDNNAQAAALFSSTVPTHGSKTIFFLTEPLTNFFQTSDSIPCKLYLVSLMVIIVLV